jgi:hypothetical protein
MQNRDMKGKEKEGIMALYFYISTKLTQKPA